VSLIASFHYKKKNFHLVKLLEPIFIVGKRIDDIKGYYFTLLDPEESTAITPVLEELMVRRANDNKFKAAAPASKDKRTSSPSSQSKAPPKYKALDHFEYVRL
jgi:hypothetical protein